MRSASYVYLRPDTGSYAFRWTIPAALRPLPPSLPFPSTQRTGVLPLATKAIDIFESIGIVNSNQWDRATAPKTISQKLRDSAPGTRYEAR
jgi:hypothetical protein